MTVTVGSGAYTYRAEGNWGKLPDGRKLGDGVGIGDIGFGTTPDRFIAPPGMAVDSHGDVRVGEVAHAAWPSCCPDRELPADLRTFGKLTKI